MPRFIHQPVPPAAPVAPGDIIWESGAERYNARMAGLAEMAGRCAIRPGRYREEPIPGTTSIVGPNGFELTLTNELHRRVNGDFATVRHEFVALVGRIMRNPHGETSIDEGKDTDAGRTARLVHYVDGPLADLVPRKELAIKGTGLDMEFARHRLEGNGVHRVPLADQFRATLEFARLQKEKAPDGIGGLVMVNEVFGVVRYPDENGEPREWMLMERLHGKTVENFELRLAMAGRGMRTTFGFSADEHPELARLASGMWFTEIETPLFEDLGVKLAEQLSIKPYDYENRFFSDLHGSNLMRHADGHDGHPRYTMFDINAG